MGISSIISSTLSFLSSLSKKRLIEVIDELRKRYVALLKKQDELVSKIEKLEAENQGLRSLQIKEKVKSVNLQSNKPSSKQAEWEIKGVGNDGNDKKKGRGKKGRKGAGNSPKNKVTTQKETAKVERCINCGADLTDQAALKTSNTRTIEDIPKAPVQLEIIQVEQEKKYCHICKKVTTASSKLALPKSDIGMNTTIQLVFMWINMCLPFTRISEYFDKIYGQSMSTAGLSSHVIKVGNILSSVYDEILEELRESTNIHADETGWRVNGAKWWLWVIGNKQAAYYTIDKSRGKDVVRRILGEVFMGVLIVDGWKAYLSLICEQQSCMAHLLRKIRNLYGAFPKLRSICAFYIKFRKILRDGERLQSKQDDLEDHVFKRRLDKLHQRLDDLLNWPNPNDILKTIIKKVNNQRPRILTFVEHANIPCHNNFGEYLIRIGVLKRKVSFGSKSAKGAQAYAILLSIYTTCKLKEISFIDFLKHSLQHYTQKGKPMLLKEYIQYQSYMPMAA